MSKKPKPIRTPRAVLEHCLNKAIVREAVLKYKLGLLKHDIAAAEAEKEKNHERAPAEL